MSAIIVIGSGSPNKIYFFTILSFIILARLHQIIARGRWIYAYEWIWIPQYCVMWYFFASWMEYGSAVIYIPIAVGVVALGCLGFWFWFEQRSQ